MATATPGPLDPSDAEPPLSAAQREAAVAALTVHLESGRLTSSQFEDRQVLVGDARTWRDLDRLFVDLPEPHPRRPRPPDAPAPSPSASPPAAPIRTGGWNPAWTSRLMLAAPILALLLFLATKRWHAFLLIPLVYIFAGRQRG